MIEKDIYTISEGYAFEGTEEGTVVALFAILEELKKMNKTIKQRSNDANTTR